LRPTGPETESRRGDLHTRRASSFGALGQGTLEGRELEAALPHLDPQQIARRCELVLALARAWFLLLDVRPVEQYATEALQLAEGLQRADLAANATAWLARCRQATGDLGAARRDHSSSHHGAADAVPCRTIDGGSDISRC